MFGYTLNIEVPFGGFLVSLIKELMNILKQKLKDNFIRTEKKKKKTQTQGSPNVKCQQLPGDGEWRRVVKEARSF